MKEIVERLYKYNEVTAGEYLALLKCKDPETLELLYERARQTAQRQFGFKIYVRGLIEITNRCRNNCYYCGLRKGNTKLERYSLTREEILDCCRKGYALGFRTFVLQGGEDPAMKDSWITQTVRAIHKEFPQCAITLSLGERSDDGYEDFYDAGARRYLLRHETYNAAHYAHLHPAEMDRLNRMMCLRLLVDLGYQTGTGIMVGSPGQTEEELLEDIWFISRMQPAMIGIGPFIPHADTPFANEPAGSLEMTLKMIAIFRLTCPQALIPSTTALASLVPDGRLKGILAGANVVMPNLSPVGVRDKYSIYNGKVSAGGESAEGLKQLEEELNSIGYHISYEKGDYKGAKKRR